MSDHERPDHERTDHEDDAANPYGREPDAVFADLERADPAAHLEPDEARLKALVESRIGTVRQSSGSSQYLWMRVAAAVVGAAVIGAAGFIIGSRNSAGSAVTNAASSASSTTTIAAQQNQPVGPAPEAGLADSGEIRAEGAYQAASSAAERSEAGAGGSQPVASDASSRDALGISMGRAVFTDGGVTGDAGTAQAYSYDAASVVTPEVAQSLAAAFGISGSATAQWGSWTVGPNDGTGPTLQLQGDGMASFYYYDPTISYGYGCEYPMSSGVVEDGVAGAGAAPDTVAPCSSSPPPPSTITAADATARVVKLITAVGQDPSVYTITADETQKDYGYLNVTALAAVDGVAPANSYGWQISFYGDVLGNANGQLAPLVSAGSYPVISAADAIGRLGDVRFGPIYPTYPNDYVWPDDNYGGATQENAPPAAPAAVTDGGPIPWAVAQVTITDATLGLSPQYLVGGAIVLAPSYTLTAADGLSWTVIAVADSGLDFG